jgi:cytochrome P450
MAEVSLSYPEMLADPYPAYARLRNADGVPRESVMGTWVLARYEDVYEALRDHETFSSAQGVTPGGSDDFSRRLPLIMDDPPRHTAVRRLVNTAFTRQRVREMTPAIEKIATDLLGEIEGEVDIVEALTVPLPVIVISRVLGIPEADGERFKLWSDAVTGVLDAGPEAESVEDIFATRSAAIMEMLAYFAQSIAERRQDPGDDLISLLVQAEIDGERMSDTQLIGFCILLLIAGNETTTNLIGNSLNILADRPELWQRLRRERNLVEGVIEETLRFDSPVQMLWRTTTRPVQLRGTTIPEGEKVMVAFAAANRDAAEFAEPDEFNPERDWASHVAFGYGTHYCLGSPLARVEASVALNALLDRFPRLERGEPEPRRLPSLVLRGFSALPLRLQRG